MRNFCEVLNLPGHTPHKQELCPDNLGVDINTGCVELLPSLRSSTNVPVSSGSKRTVTDWWAVETGKCTEAEGLSA